MIATVDGREIRFLCGQGFDVERLCTALGGTITSPLRDQAGFLLLAADGERLATLSDRGGRLLARERTDEQLLDRTIELVASLHTPTEAKLGLNGRAVARDGHVAIGPRSLTADLATMDRRLERDGWQLLPSLRTWIGDHGVIEQPSSQLSILYAVAEHAPLPSEAELLTHVMAMIEPVGGAEAAALLAAAHRLTREAAVIPVVDTDIRSVVDAITATS